MADYIDWYTGRKGRGDAYEPTPVDIASIRYHSFTIKTSYSYKPSSNVLCGVAVAKVFSTFV
jgi:hypothetical protein